MIYKFRVFSEENEKFLRSIEVDEDDTFLSFNRVIQTSVGFDPKEIASFYLSNDEWDRLTQITLKDLIISDEDDIFPMETTKLSEFITEEGENLIYVFDFLSDRVFYIVLSEIKSKNSQLSYPLCTQKIGEAPPQSILNSKNLKRITTNSPVTNTDNKSSKVLKTKPNKIVVTKPTKMGKSDTKSATDNKKISAKAKDTKKTAVAKKDKKTKTVAEKPIKVNKPVKSAKTIKPVKPIKVKAVVDKKQQKTAISSKKLKDSVKKKKLEDNFDGDDLLIEDELETFATKKKASTSKTTAKKNVTAAKTKKAIIDEDFDDDDDIDDDETDEVKEEYGFDEDELDELGNLDDLEDLEELDEFNDFTKKIAGKKFSSIEDFEEEVADDIEEDDFYDDPMFDNIDDYTDRI